MKLLALVFTFSVISLNAERMFVLAPYAGIIENTFENEEYSLDLQDSRLMEGLYLQWIDSNLFQINTFIYGSNDLHNSYLFGGHLNGDLYLLRRANSKMIAGVGLEFISPGVNENMSSPVPMDIGLRNNIYVPFGRFGYDVSFSPVPFAKVSVFPWIGVQYEVVRGGVDITADFDGPGPGGVTTVSYDIEDEGFSTIAGIRIGINIFHVIDISAKYKATVTADNYFNSWDAMSNINITRNFGLSYRYKYSQNENGNLNYHIFGIVVVL